MKISASKKTILILSLSFLFIIIAIILTLYKDVIRNGVENQRWYVVDKYAQLFNSCDYSRNKKELKVTCNALLYSASEVDKQIVDHCYNFVTIPQDNQEDTFLLNLCEQSNKVKWDDLDKWLEKDRMTPVKYSLLYKQTSLFRYEYDSLQIEDATDKELNEVFYQNLDAQQFIGRTNTESVSPDLYHNFVFMESDTFGIPTVGHIYMLNTTLIKKEKINNDINLTFKSRIGEKEIIFTAHTQSFLFFPSTDLLSPKQINENNINELLENKNYQLKLFYLNTKDEALIQDVESKCETEAGIQNAMQSLCENKEILIKESFKSSTKDNIIQQLLDSTEAIELNNVIIYVIYNLSD